MGERKRRSPSAKTRLKVLKRDGYRCVVCGANPITSPGVELEVDHYEPFSKGGADDDTNFQTLCQRCNRGKGNDETLNKALETDIDNLLDRIHPAIRPTLNVEGATFVYANSEDFIELQRKNERTNSYRIDPTDSVIIGRGAGGGQGIYTLVDTGGQKVHFRISR